MLEQMCVVLFVNMIVHQVVDMIVHMSVDLLVSKFLMSYIVVTLPRSLPLAVYDQTLYTQPSKHHLLMIHHKL